MFGLGFGEIILLAIIALLVFGPDQLPIVARNVARFLNELKRTTEDFKKELKVDEEISSTLKELKELRSRNLIEEALTEDPKQNVQTIESKVSAASTQEAICANEGDPSSTETLTVSQNKDSNTNE